MTTPEYPHTLPPHARLLARLLGRDDEAGRARAARVLDATDGAAGLLAAPRSLLVSAGLDGRQADRVRAAMALASSAALASTSDRRTRHGRKSVVAMLRPVLLALAHEELHAVHLAADGTFLGRQRVAKGGVSALSVFGREVLGPALEARATHLVLAHNHPSGLSRPSPEDFALSRRVLQAAEVVGLTLVDHMVFARDGVSTAMSPPRWHMLSSGDAA